MQRKAFLHAISAGTVGLAALFRGPSGEVPAWDPASFSGTESDFWAMVRRQYPLRAEPVYLNTGGLGPASYGVIDKFNRTMMELQVMSETGHGNFEPSRETMAAFLNAKSTEICFTRNATESNSIVAAGLELEEGDEVIFESHAHPGGSFPWLNRQKLHGIKVKVFEPSPVSMQENLDRIEALITARTKVIQISHITAPTGIVFNARAIADLAHSRGIWFHVDGAQSMGMIPIDLKAMDCDSYGTSGHKWLGAPHETGILYVKESRLDEVDPLHIGAYSNQDYKLPDQFSYTPTAVRYEYGTRNAAAVVGVAEAAKFQEAIGREKIAAYGKMLAWRLQEGLRKLPDITVLTPTEETMRGSITTFKHNTIPYDKLNAHLGANKLRCRIVTEEDINAVRVSTHVFTNEFEVDRVIEAARTLK